MARRSKYTPDVVKRLTDAIKLGATYELACNYAGIHIDTFCHWRNTKPEFSEAVSLAEGAAVVGWLARIEKAASDGTWQAAAWKLERRYPEQYGRTVQDQRLIERAIDQLAAEEGLTPEQRARVIDMATRKRVA